MQNINLKPKATGPLLQWLWPLGLVVVIIACVQFFPAQAAADTAGEINNIQGCAECHEDLVADFKNTAHAVIDTKLLADRAGAKFSCTACHGKLDKHIEEGDAESAFSFKTKSMTNAKVKVCLSCHKDNHAEYLAGPHGKASLDCTQCHGIHMKTKQSLLKGGAVKVCYSCHEDVFAKFKLNERHRLMEGILTCSDCHNPHKPAARERLAGFKQQSCYKCHTDKQGPFLYEHESVRVEGCTICHDVHGSPNRHMLVDQSVSQLCYGCHTTVPGWHSRFTPDSNCVNCHSTIHGSNFSPKFLK